MTTTLYMKSAAVVETVDQMASDTKEGVFITDRPMFPSITKADPLRCRLWSTFSFAVEQIEERDFNPKFCWDKQHCIDCSLD